MSYKPVPRFEPEVVEAEAQRRGGDDEKVATTSVRSVNLDGVILSSRYDKAHEYDQMAFIVEGIDARLRSLIDSVFCDSKAWVFSFNLNPCTQSQAKELMAAVEAVWMAKHNSHNGMTFHGVRGGMLILEPDCLDSDFDI